MTALKEGESVRVRFAPSPTGFFHIGSARTVLFNWIFARQRGGSFILRIEDTDSERSKPEYEEDILAGIRWLGLDWDEGPDKSGPFSPYRQSERREFYKKYLEKLLEEKKAYFCFCSKEQLEIDRQNMLAQGIPPKYAGRCRNVPEKESEERRKRGDSSVIRFASPETEIEFNDIVRGKVKFDVSLAGDIIIAKGIDEPLYNFAATVDDEMMNITHVIRGEEHLSNTPKQIILQEALGFRPLKYAHIPLILNPDRTKMSKRYLESSVRDYREQGYLPEAVANFLVLLGWHPKDDREILSLEEILSGFDIKRVQKAGAIFNIEKLNWLNSQVIKNKNVSETLDLLRPFLKEKNISVGDDFVKKVITAEKERLKTLRDFLELAGFFFELPDYEPKLLIWKDNSSSATKTSLRESEKILNVLPEENFIKEKIAAALQQPIEKMGRGAVLWPLRAAVSGKKASPDPFEIIEILGKKETARRLEKAIEKINSVIA
ncbi:MAG: glutamate--tRNA ligase [Candidatus Liptonbacteria bacterium]|nr:glutamate--tRNA ligase [Candidatus Liptonbacteria bacterium]